MHGIVHAALKEYVTERAGPDRWETVRERAGVEPALYLSVSHYDDEDFDAVVDALASLSRTDERAIQRDFGRHLAPSILKTFRSFVKGCDSTADLLAILEGALARLAASDDDLRLPDIRVEEGDGTLTVTYRSNRRLCALAHGVIEGASDYYDDGVDVDHVDCVEAGDDACRFVVADPSSV